MENPSTVCSLGFGDTQNVGFYQGPKGEKFIAPHRIVSRSWRSIYAIHADSRKNMEKRQKIFPQLVQIVSLPL